MKNFQWQHIQFLNDSNPYICTTEKKFKEMQKKYTLTEIKDGFWMAEEKKTPQSNSNENELYQVILSACGNIDHGENPDDNVVNGIRVLRRIAKATSINECQRIVREYIEDNDLGAGNWTGGNVFKGKKKIGYISYNGRYWNCTRSGNQNCSWR